MRHGPHQGAQKSTISGRLLSDAAVRNAAASAASIGSPGAFSVALHVAQRIDFMSAAYGMRFCCPHDGQVTITPFASRRPVAISACLLAPGAIEDPQHDERLVAATGDGVRHASRY